MTRGFQIWSLTLNLTILYPFLAKKPKTGFCQFSTVSCQEWGQNVVRFNFLELTSSHLQHKLPLFVKILKFSFLVPYCNFKISNRPCGQFFSNSKFSMSDSDQRPKKHKNMRWCSHRIADKMVITTWPTQAPGKMCNL